ncbi:hypothetical protein Tco_0919261 [Tanacetum coccineum]
MEGSMGEQEQEGGTERERERKSEQREFNRENQNDKKKFDDLVKDVDQFLQEELLPHGNILPKKHHEVKNIMNKLGLGWRPNQEDNSGDKSGDEAGMQDEPSKIVYSSKTTHLMKWHHLERVKDGKLRHPTDALSWKHFDEKHPEFASDHRNVRLALAKLRQAPIVASGDDILNQLKGVDFLFENVENSPWKKKSIFFTLPYWKNLLLRHNLDVMHIEKNVCDNIVGTLLGQVGKSKDNLKARLDLEKWDTFLETLRSIKPPDEYSPNISHCLQLKERKVMGMKSYDCHMLMQEYMPIALLGTLPDYVSKVGLMTHKSYVSNKAYPGGSIVEGYLVRASLTLCSQYLSGVETLFTRPIRNDDDGGDNQNEIEESNFLRPGRP